MHTDVKAELPAEQQRALRKLVRLEWISIIYLISAIVLIMVTMGRSQAMKTAWFDDLLSLAPPIIFLVSERVRRWPPTKTFPYGYNRIVSIGFLIAATALTLMGSYLFINSASKLIEAERASIGTVRLFGHTFWAGWLMILASVWSGLPAAILGHYKQPLALEVHNKLAYADTSMDRADWMVAVATIIGIGGVGFGWWWADGLAALFISIEIIKDGFTDIVGAVSDLIDQVPTTLESRSADPIVARVNDYFHRSDWVRKSVVTLREDGHLFTGDAYIVPESEDRLIERIDTAIRDLRGMDWRLRNMTITPVRPPEFEAHLV